MNNLPIFPLQPEEVGQEAVEEPLIEPLLEPEGENYEEPPQVSWEELKQSGGEMRAGGSGKQSTFHHSSPKDRGLNLSSAD